MRKKPQEGDAEGQGSHPAHRPHTDPKLSALIKILVQPTNMERNENSINRGIQQSHKE